MSKLIQTVLGTRAGYGLTVLRVFVGIIFAAHGSQKLFGWFGGGGLAGTAQWMESIGLAPGTLMALLSGGTEFFGGLALIVGLLARPAALGLSFTLLVAILSVQAWSRNGEPGDPPGSGGLHASVRTGRRAAGHTRAGYARSDSSRRYRS